MESDPAVLMPDLDATRKVHTALLNAKALIKDPDRWTQNKMTGAKDGKATWCLRGAVLQACNGAPHFQGTWWQGINSPSGDWQADRLLALAAQSMFEPEEILAAKSRSHRGEYADNDGDAHVLINNAKTHVDIMFVMDRAIAMAEKRLGEVAF